MNLIRFFDYNHPEKPCFAQYKYEDMIVPNENDLVWVDTDTTPYRVDAVTYSYDKEDVMIDIFVHEDNYEYPDDGEFECDGECEYCELNDAGMTEDTPKEVVEDKTDYNALLRNAIADLFGELGVKVEFTKE